MVPSRLHELHESKFPFVSRIECIRSKLSNFSAHVYGAAVFAHFVCLSPPCVARQSLSASWGTWDPLNALLRLDRLSVSFPLTLFSCCMLSSSRLSSAFSLLSSDVPLSSRLPLACISLASWCPSLASNSSCFVSRISPAYLPPSSRSPAPCPLSRLSQGGRFRRLTDVLRDPLPNVPVYYLPLTRCRVYGSSSAGMAVSGHRARCVLDWDDPSTTRTVGSDLGTRQTRGHSTGMGVEGLRSY